MLVLECTWAPQSSSTFTKLDVEIPEPERKAGDMSCHSKLIHV